MIIMIHANYIGFDGRAYSMDRKFHIGMQQYAKALSVPITTVNPLVPTDQDIMDRIDVPLSEMDYQIMVIRRDSSGRTLPGDLRRLNDALGQVSLMYGGGPDEARLAKGNLLKYILIREKDLDTEMDISLTGIGNPVRRLVRKARQKRYFNSQIEAMKDAWGIHCNGYPVYDESQKFNSNCLLYLDSRMSQSQLISESTLNSRLSDRCMRRVRCLFSGRYEPIKGPLDAIKASIACLNKGLDMELHCYGQGSLRDEMKKLVALHGAGDRIFVNEAVSYPRLLEIARDCDLFICCHVQGDPSCTYLETLGSGLPIAGYGNSMWRGLCGTAAVGVIAEVGRSDELAEKISELISDEARLNHLSLGAREFAANHTFEMEFAKRTNSLKQALYE